MPNPLSGRPRTERVLAWRSSGASSGLHTQHRSPRTHRQRSLEGAEVTDRLDGLLADSAMVRLRAVLEDRPDAVLSLTAPDLTVLWAATRGAEGVYERDPSQYEGASTWDFVHPDDQD